jgi:hypothetical protein
MNTCPTGKRGHATFEMAEEALIGAHIAYNFGKHAGPMGVYICDECQQFHLTSQGEMNSRLKTLIESGELKKLKEASWWEGKIKRK